MTLGEGTADRAGWVMPDVVTCPLSDVMFRDVCQVRDQDLQLLK